MEHNRPARAGQRLAGIQAWAVREDARVAAWYANLGVCSVAPVADRPALQATLGALRRHRAGLLVVAKRDRVARDVVLAAEVERARNARAPAW